MSHAALCKMYNIDYLRDHRISLGSLSDRALERYLGQHPDIKQIIFALDNDIDGKAPDGSPCNHGQKAAEKFALKYTERGYDTAVQSPTGKDFNVDLMEVHRERTANRTVSRATDAEVWDGDDLAV
jgi:hypothetical protein